MLLLDEPLGALDLKLRQEMQVELKRIQREVGITFVYVTHDQEEALTMSDRLAVFNRGRIEQLGAPAEVYERPATEFVAGFVGTSNVLERDGRRFAIRPEKIRILDESDAREPGARVEAGHVRDVVYVGVLTRYVVELDGGGTLAGRPPEPGALVCGGARGAGPSGPARVEAGAHDPHREGGERMSHPRRRGLGWVVLALLVASLSLVAAGCGGDDDEEGSGAAATGATETGAAANLPTSVGEGEGELNLIAWAGYVEDGSTDPKVDWVTDFEEETGCQVNTKVGNTSDEMVTLMRTGNYDGVSASGDATLRLIAGGDVAPVNTDLIPNYADVYDALKQQPHNSVDGQMYGVPHGRGANLLMWRTDEVKPAPDSWSVVFDENSPYKGKVTAYDSPIYIADAALYLMATQPDLGIKNPYALDDDAVPGRDRPAEEAAGDHRRVLVGLHQGARGLQVGRLRGRHDLAGHRQPRQGRQGADRDDAAQGGLHRLVGHVDDRVGRRASELHVHVDGPHHLAEGERGRGGVVRRGALEREGLRRDGRRQPLRDLPRRRRGVLRPGVVLDDADEGVPRRAWCHLQGLLRMGPGLDRGEGVALASPSGGGSRRAKPGSAASSGRWAPSGRGPVHPHCSPSLRDAQRPVGNARDR